MMVVSYAAAPVPLVASQYLDVHDTTRTYNTYTKLGTLPVSSDMVAQCMFSASPFDKAYTRITSTGTVVYAKQFYGSYGNPDLEYLGADPSGNTYFNWIGPTASFPNETWKISPTGTVVWSGGLKVSTARVWDLAVDSSGNSYHTYYLTSRDGVVQMNSGGTVGLATQIEWPELPMQSNVCSVSATGGDVWLAQAMSTRWYLSKWTSAGYISSFCLTLSAAWISGGTTVSYGGVGYTVGVKFFPNGDLLVLGSYGGTNIGAVMTRVTTSGTIVWTRRIIKTTQIATLITHCVIDSSSNIYFRVDALQTHCIDGSGSWIWSRAMCPFGGSETAFRSITLLNDGRLAGDVQVYGKLCMLMFDPRRPSGTILTVGGIDYHWLNSASSEISVTNLSGNIEAGSITATYPKTYDQTGSVIKSNVSNGFYDYTSTSVTLQTL